VHRLNQVKRIQMGLEGWSQQNASNDANFGFIATRQLLQSGRFSLPRGSEQFRKIVRGCIHFWPPSSLRNAILRI
jgi:hypothetical protein